MRIGVNFRVNPRIRRESVCFGARSCCFMRSVGPVDLRFRFKAKHRNASFNQVVGIKPRTFLERDSFFCEIATTYAVHERLDLLDRWLDVVFGEKTFSRFGTRMFFSVADYEEHRDKILMVTVGAKWLWFCACKFFPSKGGARLLAVTS